MPFKPTETQASIIQSGLEALLVQAGPGSGKTYVITERIRHLLSQPDGHFHVLGLTFTNKAAGEMKRRLLEFPDLQERSYIGTIHGFCAEVLRERGAAIGLESAPTILESSNDQKALLYRAIENTPDLRAECERRFSRESLEKIVGNWLNRIGEAKRGILAKSLPVDPQGDPLFLRVFEVYGNLMRAMGLVDFDDLLLLTRQLFIERPKIAAFFRKLYRFICFD